MKERQGKTRRSWGAGRVASIESTGLALKPHLSQTCLLTCRLLSLFSSRIGLFCLVCCLFVIVGECTRWWMMLVGVAFSGQGLRQPKNWGESSTAGSGLEEAGIRAWPLFAASTELHTVLQ
jgi:hypothetical protein